MRKWLPRAYGTHHNTASTARDDKNPTREFRRINPGLILLKVASTVPGLILLKLAYGISPEFRCGVHSLSVHTNMYYECSSVCVVCVFSSHPFWTSSSLDVPAGVTQEEGHTGFLIHLPSAVRALIFVARRIQPFLFLVDREVEFCVLTN